MNCPACGNSLQEVTVSDVVVDVCKGGCGGIWFDNFEITKFDEPHESAGEELLQIERDESVVIDRAKRFNCPKCEDVVMMRHFFTVKKEVEVDECPGCGGFWLDAGELDKIRGLFETEHERHAAAHEYFAEMFGSELAAMEAEDQANLNKARKIANMFRFVCPSYYVPGKQDWGAF
ncbi:MAG: zf-TFIIB domain-containing protein [Phycisphaerales bacterium]|nr:MAG: zf-TFIIB domain-containing protein [Phycisphaerales bacterium]